MSVQLELSSGQTRDSVAFVHPLYLLRLPSSLLVMVLQIADKESLLSDHHGQAGHHPAHDKGYQHGVGTPNQSWYENITHCSAALLL
jgi:hypothetical protein